MAEERKKRETVNTLAAAGQCRIAGLKISDE